MIVLPVFKKSLLPLFLSRGIRFRAAFLIAVVPVIIALFQPGKIVSAEPRSQPMFPLAACLLGAVIPFSRSRNKRDQAKDPSGQGSIEVLEMLQVIHAAGRDMVSILEKRRLLDNITETFTTDFDAKKIVIYLPVSPGNATYAIAAHRGYDTKGAEGQVKGKLLDVAGDDALAALLLQRRDIVEPAESGGPTPDAIHTKARQRMRGLDGDVCVPFFSREKMVGFCLLGGRGDIGRLTDMERRALSTLAEYAAVALDNARLFESVKKMKLSLRRSDRLASLGTLTAGLAHEIRNPLVSVHTFLQLLPERYEDHDFRTQFHSLACDEMNRVNALLDELLSFSRPSEPNLRPGDLNGTVEKMLTLIGAEARKKGIEIVRDLAVEMPEIIMDREQVKQVLMNLFLNALQAMPTGGIMTVRSRFVNNGSPEFGTEMAGADFVILEVRDTGMGIPPRDMENLFNPFFTTKEEGTGLGLSIAYQIIREHGGCIDVESQPGNGAAFIVTLPVNTLSSGCREQDRHKEQL